MPPQTAARRLLVVSFIDSLGTGAFLTGSALFLTGDIGLTPAQAGFGLSLASAIGFICLVPIGWSSDRIGPYRALVALQFWRSAGFFAYPFVDGFGTFLVVACVVGVGEWAAPPIVQSLVGRLVPEASRVRTMSAMMMLRNIGYTIGAASAAWAIALGDGAVYRGLVFANAASFLVSGLVLLGMRSLAGDVPTGPADDTPVARGRPPGPRFLALTALNGLLFLHAVLLTVGLPLWVVSGTSVPGWVIGAIVVTNTVFAVGLQLRLSRGVDGLRSGASRQRRAGLALAVCCGLIALAETTSPAVTVALALAATVALTLGEIYQSVGAWAVSYAMAPVESRGRYLSIYNLGATGAMILGPWLVTAVVLPAGYAGWLGLGLLLAVVGAIVPVIARRAVDVRGA